MSRYTVAHLLSYQIETFDSRCHGVWDSSDCIALNALIYGRRPPVTLSPEKIDMGPVRRSHSMLENALLVKFAAKAKLFNSR